MLVLDLGFVRLIDHMGDDLSIANAARVSFGKRKESWDEKDAILVDYLAENEHTSPFRHVWMTFHVKAPIFVLRQWVKHRIGSEINEISGRYVEFQENEVYVPHQFRQQAIVNKQGSEGEIEPSLRAKAQEIYISSCRQSLIYYKELLKMGVCKEQARAVLPLGLYSEIYWTASLQAVAHFIKLRTDAHAQWEIQQYGHAIHQIAQTICPHGLEALLKF